MTDDEQPDLESSKNKSSREKGRSLPSGVLVARAYIRTYSCICTSQGFAWKILSEMSGAPYTRADASSLHRTRRVRVNITVCVRQCPRVAAVCTLGIFANTPVERSKWPGANRLLCAKKYFCNRTNLPANLAFWCKT